jgi:glycosyltransferase involved in cell wall biosynthesis
MKIGFDAKWFFTGNPSGRVVVRNVIRYLPPKHPEHDFYIFLKSTEKRLIFPYKAPNVHLIYVWGKISLFSNIIFIPLKAHFLALDVCLFQYSAPPLSFFKRIVYIYDIIFEDSPQYFSIWERIYFAPLRFLARRSHRICTISESEKRRMVRHRYGTDDKIDAVHLGVDPIYKPRDQHPLDGLENTKREYSLPDEYMLYVGRLNERKNLLNLLKAISLLKHAEIPLVLAGSYQWKMFNLPAIINDLKLKERIICTGFVKDEYLPFLYSMSKIFCYVSFDEGFGFPPLEAMASGVPVVVANTGSLPEICMEAGNFVDPHDAADIARMIDRLLDDKVLYEKKREMGIQRAKEFDWERTAERLFESMLKAVDKNR